jgi:membrane protein implicated in regulation of membrane protease activity
MRFPREYQGPTAVVWLLAAVSLLLPVVGVVMALYGLFEASRGDSAGWYWLAGGTLLILADMIADWAWARWGPAQTDEPALNRRGAQLVGETVVVDQAIEAGGRGSVRAGDTVWPAEGAAAATGARVRVTGANGNVLTVELA